RLENLRPPPIERKGVLDPVPLLEAAWKFALGHKEGFLRIPPPRQIPFKPQKRPIRKKEQTLLVAFPNDLGLFALPKDIAAIQGQDLRNPRSRSKEHFHQCPKAQSGERHLFPHSIRGNDRLHKTLHLFSRQIEHISPRDARDADLTRGQGGHP